MAIDKQLETLRKLNSEAADTQVVVFKGQKTAFSRSTDWNEIRKIYILGKRIEEEDRDTGILRIWSESYTLAELSTLFGLPYQTLTHRCAKEVWVDLRESYLARINSESMGKELAYFQNEESQVEALSLGMLRKMAKLTNLSIEQKYGAILDAENTNVDFDISNEDFATINPKDLAESVKVLKEVVTLQKQIMDNAPRTNQEMIAAINKKEHLGKLKDKNERKALQEQLQQKLALLAQIEED